MKTIKCTPIPMRVWIEATALGQSIVVVQIKGLPAFDYAVFNYSYGYTDNASIRAAAERLALSLGAVQPITYLMRELDINLETS